MRFILDFDKLFHSRLIINIKISNWPNRCDIYLEIKTNRGNYSLNMRYFVHKFSSFSIINSHHNVHYSFACTKTTHLSIDTRHIVFIFAFFVRVNWTNKNHRLCGCVCVSTFSPPLSHRFHLVELVVKLNINIKISSLSVFFSVFLEDVFYEW